MTVTISNLVNSLGQGGQQLTAAFISMLLPLLVSSPCSATSCAASWSAP
jgi:hypothetical protein